MPLSPLLPGSSSELSVSGTGSLYSVRNLVVVGASAGVALFSIFACIVCVAARGKRWGWQGRARIEEAVVLHVPEWPTISSGHASPVMGALQLHDFGLSAPKVLEDAVQDEEEDEDQGEEVHEEALTQERI